jgi:hypothetical protein
MEGLTNYVKATLASPEAELSNGAERWVLVYCASALTNGAVYELSYLVDTGTINTDASATAPMIVHAPVTPTTCATDTVIIGVVDNSPLNLGTIAAGTFGYFKVQGVVQALCEGTAAIAIGDQLGILNNGTALKLRTAAVAGVTGLILPHTCAIAMEAYAVAADALKYVNLLGRQCLVDAS